MRLSFKAASVLLAARAMASDPVSEIQLTPPSFNNGMYTYLVEEMPKQEQSKNKVPKNSEPVRVGVVRFSCEAKSGTIFGPDGSGSIAVSDDGVFFSKNRVETALSEAEAKEVTDGITCDKTGPNEAKVKGLFVKLRRRFFTLKPQPSN